MGRTIRVNEAQVGQMFVLSVFCYVLSMDELTCCGPAMDMLHVSFILALTVLHEPIFFLRDYWVIWTCSSTRSSAVQHCVAAWYS